MSNDLNQQVNLARKLYKDILDGFTKLPFKEEYIKIRHLTESESCEINQVYIDQYHKAKHMGLLAENDKLEILYKDKMWSKDKEQEIEKLVQDISSKKNTLSKLFIKSQINLIKNEIKSQEESLNKILKEREDLLGFTVENFAFKKSNERIIFISLYNENEQKLFLEEDDFLSLEEDTLYEYIFIYKQFLDMFSSSNIKRIAVCPFFMNNFLLSEDNVFSFYGKPIVSLTKNQIDLFSIARNYKFYLSKSNDNPPASYKNLDELVSWYENKPNLTNLKDKSKDALGQTYIGATKDELAVIASNSKEEVVDLTQEAKKSGGDLSFEEILKIHGI